MVEKVKFRRIVPFIVLCVLFIAVLFAFFYYGYGYYGLIIVGSLGSILVLIMLVKTKHKLQDEFNLYSHTGAFLLQAECSVKVDSNSIIHGDLFVYENGLVMDSESGSFYVQYTEISNANIIDNECLVVIYNIEGNHKAVFYMDNKLKMKAILQELLSRATVYDDNTVDGVVAIR